MWGAQWQESSTSHMERRCWPPSLTGFVFFFHATGAWIAGTWAVPALLLCWCLVCGCLQFWGVIGQTESLCVELAWESLRDGLSKCCETEKCCQVLLLRTENSESRMILFSNSQNNQPCCRPRPRGQSLPARASLTLLVFVAEAQQDWSQGFEGCIALITSSEIQDIWPWPRARRPFKVQACVFSFESTSGIGIF